MNDYTCICEFIRYSCFCMILYIILGPVEHSCQVKNVSHQWGNLEYQGASQKINDIPKRLLLR